MYLDVENPSSTLRRYPTRQRNNSLETFLFSKEHGYHTADCQSEIGRRNSTCELLSSYEKYLKLLAQLQIGRTCEAKSTPLTLFRRHFSKRIAESASSKAIMKLNWPLGYVRSLLIDWQGRCDTIWVLKPETFDWSSRYARPWISQRCRLVVCSSIHAVHLANMWLVMKCRGLLSKLLEDFQRITAMYLSCGIIEGKTFPEIAIEDATQRRQRREALDPWTRSTEKRICRVDHKMKYDDIDATRPLTI